MDLLHVSLPLTILRRYHDLFRTRLNLMFSFAYLNAETPLLLGEYRHMIDILYLDSGAFSHFRGVKYISHRAYIEYLLNNRQHYNLYFNLDKDFGSDGFDSNIAYQMKLEAAGLHPVPVVHNFFDDEIEYYIDSGKYDYLALGSKQSSSFRNLEYAVNKIKKLNDKIRIHWFGGSRYDWLIKLPIATCDTSSWAQTGRYGHIKYWNPQVNRTHKIYIGGRIRRRKSSDFDYLKYPWKADFDTHLYKTFNLTDMDLYSFKGVYHRQLINTHYHTEMAARINAERLKNGVALV